MKQLSIASRAHEKAIDGEWESNAHQCEIWAKPSGPFFGGLSPLKWDTVATDMCSDDSADDGTVGVHITQHSDCVVERLGVIIQMLSGHPQAERYGVLGCDSAAIPQSLDQGIALRIWSEVVIGHFHTAADFALGQIRNHFTQERASPSDCLPSPLLCGDCGGNGHCDRSRDPFGVRVCDFRRECGLATTCGMSFE